MTFSEEIAWLAGLLEGEGYFCVQEFVTRPDHRPQLVVQLEMTDLDVVERAREIFPTKTKITMYKRKDKHWQQTYKTRWYGADAEEVMRAVMSYMGRRRYDRISQCLNTPNLSHQRKIAT